MPPGLRAQIFFAVVITIGALLVLPTALSAGQPGTAVAKAANEMPSTGSIATSVRPFEIGQYDAAAFTDWD